MPQCVVNKTHQNSSVYVWEKK